jgi:hypothetical protein
MNQMLQYNAARLSVEGQANLAANNNTHYVGNHNKALLRRVYLDYSLIRHILHNQNKLHYHTHPDAKQYYNPSPHHNILQEFYRTYPRILAHFQT